MQFARSLAGIRIAVSRFLLRRFGQALVTVLGVATLVFFVQRLTGDPTYLLVPETATKADIDALRHSLGFDRPLIVQYLDFLRDLAHFDLGQSVVQRVPVTVIIASRLPYTLQLAAGALVVAAGLGIPAGVLLAMFRDRAIAKNLRRRRAGRAEHADVLERHSA